MIAALLIITAATLIVFTAWAVAVTYIYWDEKEVFDEDAD